ncbi:MAG: Rid family hydrolase [Candidatus Falkowbacteria bacterium]|nr:Rid family hydrolase [Candidatus Falkowbacteria bacterium]
MPKKQIPEGLKDIKPTGPYSPVLQIGGHHHFSGILPDLGKDNRPTSPDITQQTSQIMKKIKDLLEKCGLTFNDIFGATIMIKALDEESFDEALTRVNYVYANALSLPMEEVEILPRRKAFGVSALPCHALVEIEIDAVKQD